MGGSPPDIFAFFIYLHVPNYKIYVNYNLCLTYAGVGILAIMTDLVLRALELVEKWR